MTPDRIPRWAGWLSAAIWSGMIWALVLRAVTR